MDSTVAYEIAAKRIALEAGKEASNEPGNASASDVIAGVRKAFGRDRRSVDALEKAIASDSPQAIEQLAAALQWYAKEDPGFAQELRSWAEKASPEVRQSVQVSRDAFVAGRDQSVRFGGEGGNAPGASGGGGPAFGQGAIGGPGGPIGQIDVGGESGKAPGAGGGGSPGGDLPLPVKSSILTVTEGLAEFLGFDGKDGGDTVIKGEDGSVLLRATGGEGGLVGTGVRSESSTLAVSTLLLADSLQIRDKLAFVLGGAWEWYPILNFPASVTFMALIVVEAGDVPVGEYSIVLEARDPFDRAEGLVKFAIGITQPGDILRRSFSIPFGINVTLPGLWTIRALHEKRELACITLHIKRGV